MEHMTVCMMASPRSCPATDVACRRHMLQPLLVELTLGGTTNLLCLLRLACLCGRAIRRWMWHGQACVDTKRPLRLVAASLRSARSRMQDIKCSDAGCSTQFLLSWTPQVFGPNSATCPCSEQAQPMGPVADDGILLATCCMPALRLPPKRMFTGGGPRTTSASLAQRRRRAPSIGCERPICCNALMSSRLAPMLFMARMISFISNIHLCHPCRPAPPPPSRRRSWLRTSL